MKAEDIKDLTRLFEAELTLYSREHHLVRHDRPFHRSVSRLPYAHEGRRASGLLAAACCLSRTAEIDLPAVLAALERLQITKADDPFYGAFRWYAEEDRVNDTNAAFFIMTPLLVLMLTRPDTLGAEGQGTVNRMMKKAIHWFDKELEHPIYYYPNKIISDGALLLGFSRCLGDMEGERKALAFLDNWLAYTENRGWGWGENVSIVYAAIIWQALMIISVCLDAQDPRLERLRKLADELREGIRFHDGGQLVPSIRSYNFEANPAYENPPVWRQFGVERPYREPLRPLQSADPWGIMAVVPMMLSGYHRLGELPVKPLEAPRAQRQRIFDNAAAYTWIGRRSRLGSLNTYPLMPGCYQQETWGLGWQSFPAAFAVDGAAYGFLRWTVTLDEDGSDVRSHPSQAKSDPRKALFRDDGDGFPDVITVSAQAQQRLIAVRSIAGLHHEAARIADEWVVPHASPVLREHRTAAGVWRLLDFAVSEVTVALLPLQAVPYGAQEPGEPKVTAVIGDGHNGGGAAVTQTLYDGPARRLQQQRLESAWYVELFEQQEQDTIISDLNQTVIIDRLEADGQVPRSGLQRIRSIIIERNGETLVKLQHDPYIKVRV